MFDEELFGFFLDEMPGQTGRSGRVCARYGTQSSEEIQQRWEERRERQSIECEERQEEALNRLVNEDD